MQDIDQFHVISVSVSDRHNRNRNVRKKEIAFSITSNIVEVNILTHILWIKQHILHTWLWTSRIGRCRRSSKYIYMEELHEDYPELNEWPFACRWQCIEMLTRVGRYNTQPPKQHLYIPRDEQVLWTSTRRRNQVEFQRENKVDKWSKCPQLFDVETRCWSNVIPTAVFNVHPSYRTISWQ